MRTLLLTLFLLAIAPHAVAAEKPNFVFIMWEDSSPNLGCYGDPDAITPTLDALAKSGVRYDKFFTHAPVCAPSRSGLITGQYPTTLGSHHMRSKLTKAPAMWIGELRKAGYFTAYPGKTDVNFDLPKGWVDTTEDWTKKPNLIPKDKPFFAYINFTVSHESQARATPEQHAKNTFQLKPTDRRDPAKITLPPYYPDTPDVRRVVTNYHEDVTAVDYKVKEVLKLLDDQGWSKNTYVFAFGDHGWGLPRGKRWPIDSGTRVPMIVRMPDGKDAGTVNQELGCFLDLGPTVLALAGLEFPGSHPGRVLFGVKKQPVPEYVVACRDRMDEVEDRIRSLRTSEYRYVRNFRPDVPYFAWLNYLDVNPIMKDWRRLAFAGELNTTQKLLWTKTKPTEELYHLPTDPHEIKNLAAEPAQAERMVTFRKQLAEWIKTSNDLGEIPERELIKRGIVKNVLDGEYTDRVKLHPSTSPVP